MRKIFAVNLLLFSLVVLVDQLTKTYIGGIVGIHQNHGLFLGSFSNSPIAFRVITLVTFSGFLFFLYFVSLYLFPNKIKTLKYSLSLILGGIVGNVLDRLLLGYTRDFIPFKLYSFQSFFNASDVFLAFGCLGVIFIIFKYDNLIWIPDNNRANYLVNPKEQLRLAFKFFMASILTSVFFGIFSFSFLSVYLNAPSSVIRDFITIFCILSIIFALSTFVLGIFVSHRSQGPLYAFESYVEKLIEGKSYKLKLREGDNNKHLEKVALKLYNHFIKK